jgi:hypothetical protein
MRDLDKLQAARMPAPAPAPQPVAPPAPMMGMPSTAAHTSNTTPGFPVKEETKRAPFPDMGMGDVVDLTTTVKKATPSPRMPSGVAPRGTPPMKQSPKPTPPVKVTPIPLPQIPPPSVTVGTSAQKVPTPQQSSQPLPVAQPAMDTSLDTAMNLSSTGGAATADMTGGELNFTNMQFSLAPSSDGPIAPPAPMAPMQDFDMSSFTTHPGGNDVLSLGNFTNSGATGAGTATAETISAPIETKEAETAAPTGTNVDSMYDLGNSGNGGGVDNMDLDLDLGEGSGVNDNTFDDLFFDNEGDMGQFDAAYFGLE